ncbi:MAG: T9SS type A sorting domain-containing protein [Bacteroidales bacterium]
MKKSTKLFLLIACLAFWGTARATGSQPTIDFETLGQDWAWTLFENADNAPTLYSVVANPSAVGINTSASVAKYVVNKTGMPWAGLWSENIGSVTFTADNCKVKVMVYKDAISNFDVKFEGAAGLNFEKLVPNTKINEWEELTFDFSNQIGKTVTRLVIIPDFPSARSAGSINYFDNISFNSNSNIPVIGVPTVAAPTPTKDASKVISIFSNAYTDVAATNFAASWGQSTAVSTVNIATNPTLKYENLNYQGTELAAHVNAGAMNYLHVDVWTPNETSLQITPISPGQEKLFTLTPLTLNTWNSYDIPLSAFPNVVMSDVFQFKVVGAGGNIVYLDNLYFYDNTPVADTQAPTDFTATKGAATSSSVELLLKATDNSGAVIYTLSSGKHSEDVNGVSGVEKSFVISNLPADTTFVISVVAKDAAGNAAVNNPIEVTVKTLAAVVSGPSTAAPTPPVYAAPKVISIFSDAYTPIAGTSNFNPNWGQSTAVTTVTVAGSAMLKYSNLNYQGLEFGSDVNAVAMKYLHVDVFTNDETSLQIFPISRATGEKFVQLTPLNLNAWNSFDIPLTDFTSKGLSMADIFQFKFVGSGGKTVYLDNLYFYDNSAATDTEAPTAFTATKGIIASDGIELLLTASDNTGAVGFEITYGTTTLKTGGVSGVQKSFVVQGLTPATEYSFSIVAKDATGNIAANSPIVVTATTASAMAAAPAPTAPADKVISIFSNAYTDVANTNFNPGWGQSTVVSTVDVAGNPTLKYANLNYQGTELATHVNASSMNKLHIDVFTVNETSLQITPISPGHELLVALTPLNQNVWNSFDVPLTSFTGVVMSDIFQFKIVGSGGKTVYLDNLYFYDDSTPINTIKAENALSVYPSRVTDKMSLTSGSVMSSIQIRNLVGQLVKTIRVNATEASLDVNNLSSGNYLVSVKMANGQVITKKIVKL